MLTRLREGTPDAANEGRSGARTPDAVGAPVRIEGLAHSFGELRAIDRIDLEVKSGEGGEESALFAADLARMYIRYAERHGWTVTVLDETTSDLGGYKSVTVAVKAKGTPDPDHRSA